jgi:hypothetical protein
MYISLKVSIKKVLHQYTSQSVSFSVSDNKVEELENLLVFNIQGVSGGIVNFIVWTIPSK